MPCLGVSIQFGRRPGPGPETAPAEAVRLRRAECEAALLAERLVLIRSQWLAAKADARSGAGGLGVHGALADLIERADDGRGASSPRCS